MKRDIAHTTSSENEMLEMKLKVNLPSTNHEDSPQARRIVEYKLEPNEDHLKHPTLLLWKM